MDTKIQDRCLNEKEIVLKVVIDLIRYDTHDKTYGRENTVRRDNKRQNTKQKIEKRNKKRATSRSRAITMEKNESSNNIALQLTESVKSVILQEKSHFTRVHQEN